MYDDKIATLRSMCAGPGLEGGIETRTRTVRDSGQFAGRNFHETVELIQQAIDLVPPGNPYIDAIANALAMPETFSAKVGGHLTVRQAAYAKHVGISERTYSRYINKGCELLSKQIDVVLKMRAEGMTVDQGDPTIEGLASRVSYLEQQLVKALARIEKLESATVQDHSRMEDDVNDSALDARLRSWVDFAPTVLWRKTFGSGKVFIIKLHEDFTLTEWLEDDPSDTWQGTWKPVAAEYSTKISSWLAGSLETRVGRFVTKYEPRFGATGNDNVVFQGFEFDSSVNPDGSRGYPCKLDQVPVA
ncbi:hypothetical protein [Rhodococcus erythropolis]|uniref:Uncharacterized protein n=1 Tax=Rhodococcus erythropolis (strain PR4 / NBRC 100887) TaxID=234621 RepID=C0ZY05_RHOE4|nr:hypothetical protein [Rhodococcus erythropolis]BAH33240.1 hypothetical protein RER_25320 [Rhodococcus erythropolis PR4]